MISIVIPTISGREDSYERCLESYRATTDTEHEIITVKDGATWPTACNEGYAKAKGDIIHFTADDLEALPGWWQAATEMLAAEDVLPAAAVYDYFPPPEGKLANEEDGPDGAFVHFTRVPILTRDQYERIGTWPEIVYYADLWLSEKARTIGIRTRITYAYAFVHHWSQVGRVDSKVNMDEAGFALNRLREQMV